MGCAPHASHCTPACVTPSDDAGGTDAGADAGAEEEGADRDREDAVAAAAAASGARSPPERAGPSPERPLGSSRRSAARRARRRVRDRHLRGVRVRRDREPLVVGAIGGSPGDSGFKGGGSGRRGGGGGDRRGPRLDPRDGGRGAVGAEAHLEPEVSALGEPREVAADAAVAARGVPLGVPAAAAPAAAAPAAAAPRPMTSRRTSSTRRATWSGPDPDEGGSGPGGGGGPRARGVVVAGRRCGGVRGVGVRRTLDHQEGVAVLDARVREALVVREDATAGDEALARGGHAGDARERLLQRADLGLGGTRRGERGGGGRDGVVSGDDGRRGGGGGGAVERARRGEKTRGRRPTTSEGRRRLGRRARERTFSGTRSACSSAGSCWRTRTSMRRGAAGGAGSVEPTSAIARREGGGDRAARGARGLCQIFPPSLPGGGEPTGRGDRCPSMARGALR